MGDLAPNTICQISDYERTTPVVIGRLNAVDSDTIGGMKARLQGEALTVQRTTETAVRGWEVSYADPFWYKSSVGSPDITWNALGYWEISGNGTASLAYSASLSGNVFKAENLNVTIGIKVGYTTARFACTVFTTAGTSFDYEKTFDIALDPYTTSGGYNHFEHIFNFNMSNLCHIVDVDLEQTEAGSDVRLENMEWYKYTVVKTSGPDFIDLRYDTNDLADVQKGYSLNNLDYSHGGRKAGFESMTESFKASSDVLNASLARLYGGDLSLLDRFTLDQIVSEENELRRQQFEQQKKLNEETLRNLQLRNELLESGDPIINISTTPEIMPELESIFITLMKNIQVRATQQGLTNLIGI